MSDIRGYRDLSTEEIDRINTIKDVEERVGNLWREFVQIPGTDTRWMAIAKTHFEEGFSALFVRAIAKPEERFK